MIKLVSILGLTLVLGACATDTHVSPTQAQDSAACRKVDAPTGSNLVRKSECAPSAQAATPGETKKN